MANIGRVQISTGDVMKGMTLTVRMPRIFTFRTRIACWLLGLAGRVISVPCEIEMRDDGETHPGKLTPDERRLLIKGYQALPGPIPRGGSAVIPCNYTPTVGKAPDSPPPMPSKK